MTLSEVRIVVFIGFGIGLLAICVAVAVAAAVARSARGFVRELDRRRAAASLGRPRDGCGVGAGLSTPEMERFVRGRQAAWRLRC